MRIDHKKTWDMDLWRGKAVGDGPFDVTGRRIERLQNRLQEAGLPDYDLRPHYAETWDAHYSRVRRMTQEFGEVRVLEILVLGEGDRPQA